MIRDRDSIVDRLSIVAVLRAAGVVMPDDPKRLIRCPLPLHDDGTPSFRAFDRGFRCFGCGQHGGVLDLVVALGKAHDRASAARWLEDGR